MSMSKFIIGSKYLLNKLKFNTLILNRQIKDLEVYVTPNSLQSFFDLEILIDGYVLPRNSIYDRFANLTQYHLIATLYKEYGLEFVNYIKGFFVVLIIHDNEIILCNDIHSVKRFFTLNSSTGTIVSNDFQLIKEIDSETNIYSPSIQALLQHFVNGITPLQNVNYSIPSTIITYNGTTWSNKQYFNANDYLACSRENTTMYDFMQSFYDSINSSIKFLKASTISTTLTGGRDTRCILAALLKIGISPHCFTFGYPTGIDVVTANCIASKLTLPFSNHFIENLNATSYERLVDEIIKLNDPFIHIHRAHRLDAIKKEKDYFGVKPDIVFVGAMGGDYIKGEGFNDYIITEFLRLFLTAKGNEDEIIRYILLKHYIEPSQVIVNYLRDLLASIKLEYGVFNKSVEFNLVHNIIGSTHDIQDINIFMEHARYVIAPFMDRDVMEALFSSPFSMFSNTRHTKNPFMRLKGGELQSLMIKEFSPALAEINFANQYSPNDILGNRLLYVMKRMYLHTFKIKSKPTFTYDDWMKEFVLRSFENNKYFIQKYYDYNMSIIDLATQVHYKHEGYWHKFTNPIYLSMYNQ